MENQPLAGNFNDKYRFYFIKKCESLNTETVTRKRRKQSSGGPHQGVIVAPAISSIGFKLERARRLGVS